MPEKYPGNRHDPSGSAEGHEVRWPPGGNRAKGWRRFQWPFLLGALGVVILLAYRSPLGRELGLRCLGKFGPVSVPILRRALWDESFDVQAAAKDELIRLGDRAVPPLATALGDPKIRTRIQSLHALTALGSSGRGAAPAVIPLLNDPEVDVRVQSLNALGAMSENTALVTMAVVHAMSDAEPAVRLLAAKTLGDLHAGSEIALAPLVKALNDPDGNVRFATIVVFGKLTLRSAPALAALRGVAAHDASPKVREEANEVLALLDPQGRPMPTNKDVTPAEFDSATQTAGTEVAVHVGKIAVATLRQYVTAFGTVEPEPGTPGRAAASAKITSPLAGLVAEVKCAEGQQVEKGQILFTLDRRSLDARIEQARAALAQTNQLTITAPLAGTVTLVNIRPGEVVDPESRAALMEIVDLNRLIIAASVPASDLPAVKAGQVVEILTSPTTTGATNTLTGQVGLVEDRVNPNTDLGIADILMPAANHLRCGQFVRVKIVTGERRDCLVVPSQSLVQNEDGEWVIGLVRGKLAVQQPVTPGLREGGMVEVQSAAIRAGDKIVTTGAAALPLKSTIRILKD